MQTTDIKTRFGKLTKYSFEYEYDTHNNDAGYLLYLTYVGITQCTFPLQLNLEATFEKNNSYYTIKYTAFNISEKDSLDVQMNFVKHMQKTKPTKKQAGFPMELIIGQAKFKLCSIETKK